MGWKFWAVFFVVASTTDCVHGQQGAPANPSAHADIVRVRTGSYTGRCVGYCDHETTIEAGSIRTLRRSWSDKTRYPDVKAQHRITKREWEDLRDSINATVLAAFIGRIGCPGCADEPVEWAEVQFSDGTKKSVSYNAGNGPAAVAELLKKIHTLGAKPE